MVADPAVEAAEVALTGVVVNGDRGEARRLAQLAVEAVRPIIKAEGAAQALPPLVLLYSFRYALGRKSGAAQEIAPLLIAHHADMAAEGWDDAIIRDISVAGRLARLGHSCDVDVWKDVLEHYLSRADD